MHAEKPFETPPDAPLAPRVEQIARIGRALALAGLFLACATHAHSLLEIDLPLGDATFSLHFGIFLLAGIVQWVARHLGYAENDLGVRLFANGFERMDDRQKAALGAICYGVIGAAWSMHRALGTEGAADQPVMLFSFAWIAAYAAMYMALDAWIEDIEQRRRSPRAAIDAAGRSGDRYGTRASGRYAGR